MNKFLKYMSVYTAISYPANLIFWKMQFLFAPFYITEFTWNYFILSPITFPYTAGCLIASVLVYYQLTIGGYIYRLRGGELR